MEKDSIAHQIKELRKEKSWSQSLLAEASGLSLRTIQRLETNGKAAPETLLAVAGAFDIDVIEFTKNLTQTEESNISKSFFGIHASQSSLLLRFRSWFGKKLIMGQKLMASLGLLMAVIPVLFILSNIIKYVFGFESFPNIFDILTFNESVKTLFNDVSPFLFFSGLILASLLNLFPFLDIEISIGKRNSFRFTYHGSWVNTVLWMVGITSFGIMLLYALAENGIVMFGL